MPEMMLTEATPLREPGNAPHQHTDKSRLPNELVLHLDLKVPLLAEEQPTAALPFSSPLTRKLLFPELTLIDVMSDPMIALINRADRVDARSFTQLLESASRVLYQNH